MPVRVSLRTLTSTWITVVAVALAAPAAAQIRPDLRVSALGAPPSTGLPGDSFLVSPTVVNLGAGAAGPSSTRLYLVSTIGPIRKNLKGVQNVPGLPPGVSDSPVVTVLTRTPCPARTSCRPAPTDPARWPSPTSSTTA